MKNPITIYTPYTYLIGWSKFNKFYYGVRTARNCNPSDLFVSYFTSSKQVKRMIKEYGNPDIIQIRKTFLDKGSATKWESKVLRRLNVKDRKDFLNLCNTFPDFCTSGYTQVRNLKTGKIENIQCEEFEKNNELYEHINKGYVPVKNIQTGKNENVTCEEYKNNKGFLYEHFKKGYVAVRNLKTGEKETITCEEFEKNKGILYEHFKKGYTTVRNIKTGKNENVTCEEYKNNKDVLYEHITKGIIVSEETKLKIRESRKGKIYIVNKNNEIKSISLNEFEIYHKQGYRKGRKYI